jgi:hypothetical protein
MTTFVPPQLVRSTGVLTVEKVVISPLTGASTDVDYSTDLNAGTIAQTTFIGEDAGNNATNYARTSVVITDNTDTSEDGEYRISTMQAGTLTENMRFGLGQYAPTATGGDQGAGTINATNLYINGVAVSTSVGDVVGPASATDNAIARFDATTGKLIQNSGVLIDDSNNITGVNDLTVTGNLDVNGTLTTVDTANLAVEDSLIQLARLNNTTDTLDIGFVGLYDTSGAQDLYAGMFRDATDDKFKLFTSSQEDLSATNVVNTAATGYATATLVANLEGNVTGTASGNVANTLFDANTILKADVDDTPAALTVGASTIVGRAAAGNIDALTPTAVRTIINVEDGADVTDATNVDAAGAVMEADFNAQTVLVAVADDTPTAATIADSEFVGRPAGGNVGPVTAAQARTILNVSDGANATSKDITTYTEGVDYTGGVSTTLTLSSTPAGEPEIEVYFEGVFQASTEWSFVGTTLTFTSAIPSGVDSVEIRILTNA